MFCAPSLSRFFLSAVVRHLPQRLSPEERGVRNRFYRACAYACVCERVESCLRRFSAA